MVDSFPPAIRQLAKKWGVSLPNDGTNHTLQLQHESGDAISLASCNHGSDIGIHVFSPLPATAVTDPASLQCFLLQRTYSSRLGAGIRYGWQADSAQLVLSCRIAISANEIELLAMINRLLGHIDAIRAALPVLQQTETISNEGLSRLARLSAR
ncbi:type III secretion system chaperone [Chitinimonas arctica]|uniref:Type III secretion system chaperone n=1 Tax=Chitinimonas arctica TaxID=2594795 RepID=A0A516SJ58_9NEIS|nr:type III secretion system chaperone [Chitinimonas arctica]QDQ28177.1 type III secretion system chaperone [Chitinimonas arctica]